MVASGTYSVVFAKALLEVTRPELLIQTATACKSDTKSSGARLMLEQETDLLFRDLKAVEESYGTDILLLTVSYRYIERLLGNERVQRHLTKHHSDILNALGTLLSEVAPEKLKTIAN
jgi:hypothetical protein